MSSRRFQCIRLHSCSRSSRSSTSFRGRCCLVHSPILSTHSVCLCLVQNNTYYNLPGDATAIFMAAALIHPDIPDPKLRWPVSIDQAAEPGTGSNKLFVLTAPATFSSAVLFTVALRDNRFALSVGEAVGNQINFNVRPRVDQANRAELG